MLGFRRDGPATRRRILAAVAARPSVTVSEVCRQLGLAWNSVNHHVRRLTRQGHLVAHDNGWSMELYPAGTPPQMRALLRALHDEQASRVFRRLHAALPEAVGTYRLSGELQLSKKVVLKHVNRLVEDGLVEKLGEARPRYRILVEILPDDDELRPPLQQPGP